MVLSLLRFYYGNLKELYIIIVNLIIYRTLFKRPSTKEKESTFYIQTFIIEKKILHDKKFTDNYLRGLNEILNHKNELFKYIGFHISESLSIIKMVKLAKILRNSEEEIISEFDILTIKSLPRLLWFIITYPFFHYSLFQKEDKLISKVFNKDLLENIHQSRLSIFSKSIIGKNFSKNKTKKSRLICWYENQLVNKSFIFGIRKQNPQLNITGAQLLLFPTEVPHYYPTKEEERLRLTPDKIFYNGPFFKEMAPAFFQKKAFIGPSLRYKANLLSDLNLKRKNKEFDYLIGLPYSEIKAHDLINMLKKCVPNSKILIRYHPANTFPLPSSPNWSFSTNSILDDFARCSVLITSGSGVAAEALSQGVQTLIFDENDLSSSYLSNQGRGIIWNYFNSQNELLSAIEGLSKEKKNNLEKVHCSFEWYRNNFFQIPSEAVVNKLLKG